VPSDSLIIKNSLQLQELQIRFVWIPTLKNLSTKPGVAYAYNSSPWEAEAGGLWILGQPGLQSKTLYLKKKKKGVGGYSASGSLQP
jgi:hypothetical protein